MRIHSFIPVFWYIPLMLLLSAYSHAQTDNYHLTINTEIMVPYNFYNDKNEIVGVNVEIVKHLFSKVSITADFNLYPWVRSYQATLKTENSGLISTARTPEREGLFKWVGPLASGEGYLYKLKSRKDINVSSIDDAKNYVVAVVRGDVYQDIFTQLGFEHDKNILFFSYNAEYMKPFIASKVDLILGSNLVLPYMLAENGSDISLVEAVVKIPDTQGNYLALNKNVPDAIVDKLNFALQAMKSSQEFQEIINKYQNGRSLIKMRE